MLATSRSFSSSRTQSGATCGSASWRSYGRSRACVPQANGSVDVSMVSPGQIVDVEEVKGVRIEVDDNGNPSVEYLVQWKDGAQDTWEPAQNLADNLLRDFEERWWTAARTGNEETIRKLLGGGRAVLARAVDENGRSALHFAAALGRVGATRMLCQAGADVDQADKEGYTPLHMAAGYMHTAIMKLLLAAGANPELADRQGRTVMGLIDNLRERMPDNDPNLLTRRISLEDVAATLTDVMYEDMEPAEILQVQQNEDGSREFLVRWPDDSEDSWVNERFVSPDVIADFESGIEYADAEQLLKMRQRGDERQFLVRWLDGYPDSWEPEESLSQQLIDAYLAANPLEQPALDKTQRRSKASPAPLADGGHGNGGVHGPGSEGEGSGSSQDGDTQQVASLVGQGSAGQGLKRPQAIGV